MILLMVAKFKSVTSAAYGMLVSIIIGMCYFGADYTEIILQMMRGSWSAFTIFTVIMPAILIYELLLKADMFIPIKNKVDENIRDDLLKVLLIGWAFASFLQSITGFGVPVAVTAPILVSLGVKPVKSVLICILGHAWGGTFGTLAIAWDSLFLQVPHVAEVSRMIFYTCLMLWIYNFICGLLICFIYKGRKTTVKDILVVVLISIIQGGGELVFAMFNTSIACFLASSCSIIGILIINQIFYKKVEKLHTPSMKPVSMVTMIFPFILLTVLVILLLFIKPVYEFLSQCNVGFLTHTVNGVTELYAPISIFVHSGTILLVTGIMSILYYYKKGYLEPSSIKKIARDCWVKSINAILPILFLIIMSKIMDGTGQIYTLADSIANLFGVFYPVVAPLVGILGAFISSSNMSSNILFAGFQNHIAQIIGVDTGVILSAQTVGGSIGNLTATSNIVLGLATTGESGKEGYVMKIMIPIAVFCGLALGVLTYFLCRI